MNNLSLYTTDQIFAKYSDMVYKLAFSQLKNTADADDIFQEVFLRLVKNKENFEATNT